MLADHIGYYLQPDQLAWRIIGRAAFPIFLFLVGYSGKFAFSGRLALAAFFIAASQYYFGFNYLPLNILFSIAITRLILLGLLKTGYLQRLRVEPYMLALLLFIPLWFTVDYASIGFLYALAGYHCRKNPQSKESDLALLIAVISHAMLTLYSFNFSTPQLSFVLLILLGQLFYFRRLEKFCCPPLSWEKILLLLSRNSLTFYVVHCFLLMGMAAHFEQGGHNSIIRNSALNLSAQMPHPPQPHSQKATAPRLPQNAHAPLSLPTRI